MPIFKTGDICVYKGEKAVEAPFRRQLTAEVIAHFGKGPYTAEQVLTVLRYAYDFYTREFTAICAKETSYTFYKTVFWFHEQVTSLIIGEGIPQELAKELPSHYIASYRRILKLILETGTDVAMRSGEVKDATSVKRIRSVLDKLLFLGEMIYLCADMIAEQHMIEDCIDCYFDSNGLLTYGRRHHYDTVFAYLEKLSHDQLTKHVVDDRPISDFETALKDAFGIVYQDVADLISTFHHHFKIDDHFPIPIGAGDLVKNMEKVFNVPSSLASAFFEGLTVHRDNKMPIAELAVKPHQLHRFLYRPILLWEVDGKHFTVTAPACWDESITQLTTNAIPWGKAPKEWLAIPTFKSYVHNKEDQHDKWLDDAVEKIIRSDFAYDRHVTSLWNGSRHVSIDIKNLGEIDFIILSCKRR